MSKKFHLADQILFEDEAIIAINKPAGMLVIPDRWNLERPNLLAMLKHRDAKAKIYVVHRLDQGTSGVVLFAKTASVHQQLNYQLETRQMQKEYLAIIRGEVDQKGLIELAIDRDPHRRGRMMVSRGGKPSLTEYQVIERFRGYTYLRLFPRTGRTHQIRVHLKAIGHPLAIDPLYGTAEPLYLSKLKRDYRFKPDEPERPLIDRTPLHAAAIQFIHPLTGDQIVLTAALPKDMRAMLHALRKYQPLLEND
ncbi:MAG: RluA family pseudouridine synthase [candidate division KSB1 bacterium]|nr:RluA family pseudouridine synthase [candidate division KSB1 bacterium]MDZ7356983.1 RluA family pseudouridine synthase [candidate division KSB1 bacterium]MDZ7400955.1 RluA family pseudouridine synthase [candidate division KSB1 bacterium]